MFTNYLRMTLRTIYHERVYAAINILGLSLGFATTILLVLYLSTEFTYDTHFSYHDRIYRVVSERSVNNETEHIALVSPELPDFLEPVLPEMEAFVRLTPLARTRFESEGNSYIWDRVFIADETVFEVFSHEVLFGDPEAALTSPRSIAISESFARRYFGDYNPVGRTLQKDGQDFTVDLVFADLPSNTHLKYDVLINQDPDNPIPADADGVLARELNERLLSTSDFLYVLMPDDYEQESFNRVSDLLWERALEPVIGALGVELDYYLEPLATIHLRSIAEQDLPRGNWFYIAAFFMTTVFMLLMACINYINLSTSRAAQRAKEVGIRKIVGASRCELVVRFLSEALAYAVLSFGLSVLLAEMAISSAWLPDLLNTSLNIGELFDPGLVLAIVLTVLVTGLAAGFYPAIYLTGIANTSRLSSSKPSGRGESRVRNTLVFAQFTIAITVISVSLLMFLQVRLIQNMPLGFEKSNRITMVVQGADAIESLPAYINEITARTDVINASISREVPGERLDVAEMEIEDNDGAMQRQRWSRVFADANFIDTMGIELVSGRQYETTADYETERQMTIVNETLVEEMGWENPLGKRVGRREVIGVIADYHFHDLHNPVEAQEIRLDLPYFQGAPSDVRARVNRSLIIGISAASQQQTLEALSDLWEQFIPDQPFDFMFLEDRLDQQYESDQKQLQVFGVFSGLLVFICCMGLFGLSSYNTSRRSRELGIRKVFGASVVQIVFLLLRSVLFIVAASSLVAWCIAYLVINQWLQEFAYRVDVDIAVFIAATGIALAISTVTVTLQSWKTASSNPVEALRYE